MLKVICNIKQMILAKNLVDSITTHRALNLVILT
jgi:hypothetical protein